MASLTRTDTWPVGQRSMGRGEVRAHTDQLFAVCPSGDSVCGTVSISTDYYTRSVRQCQSCCGRRWWVWVQVRACERAETCGGNSSWRSSWVSPVIYSTAIYHDKSFFVSTLRVCTLSLYNALFTSRDNQLKLSNIIEVSSAIFPTCKGYFLSCWFRTDKIKCFFKYICIKTNIVNNFLQATYIASFNFTVTSITVNNILVL